MCLIADPGQCWIARIFSSVEGARVSLDSLLYAFLDGSTPEEIVQQYPSLRLADVYTIIAYYLQNRAELVGYLSDRKEKRARLHRSSSCATISPGSAIGCWLAGRSRHDCHRAAKPPIPAAHKKPVRSRYGPSKKGSLLYKFTRQLAIVQIRQTWNVNKS
jgi:hypothetical protein